MRETGLISVVAKKIKHLENMGGSLFFAAAQVVTSKSFTNEQGRRIRNKGTDKSFQIFKAFKFT